MAFILALSHAWHALDCCVLGRVLSCLIITLTKSSCGSHPMSFISVLRGAWRVLDYYASLRFQLVDTFANSCRVKVSPMTAHDFCMCQIAIICLLLDRLLRLSTLRCIALQTANGSSAHAKSGHLRTPKASHLRTPKAVICARHSL